MAYESVRALLNACKSEGQPLYAVILQSDLAESGLSEEASRAEMRRLCHQRWIPCSRPFSQRICRR